MSTKKGQDADIYREDTNDIGIYTNGLKDMISAENISKVVPASEIGQTNRIYQNIERSEYLYQITHNDTL